LSTKVNILPNSSRIQSCLAALVLSFSFFALVSTTACGKVTPAAGAADGGEEGEADATPIDDATPPIIECIDSTECGLHEECVMVGVDAFCECVVGYEGEPCVFVGTLLSPAFDDAAPWQVTGGASVNVGAPGIDDPGAGQFGSAAMCALGKIFQDIEMPRYEDAEPLVAEIKYALTGEDMFGQLQPPSIGFNDQWHTFPVEFGVGGGVETRRICLSDAAYGGTVRVSLSPRDKPPFGCPDSTADTISVDYLRIQPADPGECSEPGVVSNGDMQNDENWTLSTDADDDVAFVDGIGLDGSRALRVRQVTRCGSATASGRFLVPGAERLPNPAIEFDWQVSANTPVNLSLNGEPFLSLPASGGAQTQRICLPNSTHGLGATLLVRTNGGNGLCSEVINNEIILDNLKVVSEPSCNAVGTLLDGGFEYAPLVPGLQSTSQAQDGGRTFVETVSNPVVANTGSGALDLSTEVRCASATFTRQLIPPRGDLTGGPAVRVFANVPGNPVSTSSMTVAGTSFTFPENAQWTEYVECISPEYSERPAPFSLRINGGSGLCATFGAAEHAFFDDIEVIRAPQCPGG
jgi:hypothetical protein